MAAPATSRLLLTSLCAFVERSVADYEFPAPEGGAGDCRVFLHGLPDGLEDDCYPFVIARWLDGQITSLEDGQTILRDTVALALGVYAPKSQAQAGLLCAELLDLLRRALWKERLLASRFELVEPLNAAIPEAGRQMHEYHLATIETVWNYAWPPKALWQAGQSQLASGRMGVNSFGEPELASAKPQSQQWRGYE